MLAKTQRKSTDHQIKLSDALGPLASKYPNRFTITDNLILVLKHHSIYELPGSVRSFFKEISFSCQKIGYIPKKLTLKFTYEMPINDEVLQAIAELIQKTFNRLTHFTLILPNCGNATAKGFSNFMKILSKYLSELKSFSLKISHCKNSINQVTHDFKYILTNPLCWEKIQKLSLDFQACEVDNEGVKDLSACIKLVLPKLRNFNISFKRCTRVSAHGIKYLVKCFERDLPLLESLKISVAWCVQRTDEQTKALMQNILKHVPNLHTLKLDFEGHSKLSDSTIKEILRIQETQLTKLVEFSLIVAWCSLITNQGLKDIFTFTLTSLPSLKKASLDFYHCSQFDGKGVSALSESIKNGCIYYPDLNYDISEESRQDQKIDRPKEMKKHQITLTDFSLDFTQYRDQLSSELSELRKKLGFIPKLVIKAAHEGGLSS